jgi:hypothetical protein
MADDVAADDGETTAGTDDAGSAPDDSEGTETVGTDEERTGSASPFVFLLGLLAFVGSVVAFATDLVTGYDPLRSLLVNAAGAVVLVWWAGADTLSDPDSDVTSQSGAAGTGLLLLGIYLLLGAAIVGVTSLVHNRFGLVPWAAGIGIVAMVVGFLIFPRGSVLGEDGAAEPSGDGDGTAASDGGPATGTGEGDGDDTNDGKTDG